MSEQKKMKILSKYMMPANTSKKMIRADNPSKYQKMQIKDEDDMVLDSESSMDEESSEEVGKRRRIASSDEDEPAK